MCQSPHENRAIHANDPHAEAVCGQPAESHKRAFVFQRGFVASAVDGRLREASGGMDWSHDARYLAFTVSVNRQTGARPWADRGWFIPQMTRPR
jgi:hypothetical protein